MQLPHTNPVGLPVVPASFAQAPRRYPPALRGLAAGVAVLLLVVASVTTALSLGAYCLTTDTANTSALPPLSRPDAR